MKKQEKKASISRMRIVATLAVLFSHACSTLTENASIFSMTQTQHVFLQICLNLTKWAVPIFFVITGALMLDTSRELTPLVCVKKYAKRIALALLIFGVPFALMVQFFEVRTLNIQMILKAVWMVINGEGFSHLWYLYTLLGIYLILPLLKAYTDVASRSGERYLLSILFVFNFCVPFVNRLFGISIAFETQIGTYIFYLLLGQYLQNGVPSMLRKKWIASAVIVAAVVGTIVIAVLGGPVDMIWSYTSPINVICTMTIFTLFHSREEMCSTWVWRMDRLCFGVYLIHPVFIHFMYRVLHITPLTIGWYPLTLVILTLIFAVLSFAGSWLMSYIPPLKKYVL